MSDLIPVAVGVMLIIFHAKLAEVYTRFQNEKYGFRFGKKTVRFSKILNLVGGSIFLAIGLWGIVN